MLPGGIFETSSNADLEGHLFDGATLRNLLLEMLLGKTGTDDQIVVEMLRQLDVECLDVLADIFRFRLINHPSELTEKAWRSCVANLIAKIQRPLTIAQLRPIAILPDLSKLFSKLIMFLSKPHFRELRGPQFACTPNHQPHEVVFILRSIMEKSIEWALKIWILDGDIAKAYDNTRHSEVLTSILEAGCPKVLAAAWAREFS